MELKDTVNLMLSDDWRDRMKAEYLQLSIRYEELNTFINAADQGKAKYKSKEGELILKVQRSAMAYYLSTLELCMKDAGIDFVPYEEEAHNMAKKKKGGFTTDQLLNMARRCEKGDCSGKCPFYGKENCKNRLLKITYNRLYAYYSIVGELDGKE